MMHRIHLLPLFALGFLLVQASCGNGSSNRQTLEPLQQTTDSLQQQDLQAQFLLDSYSYGLMIAHYSQQAVAKASTPTLKSFAESSLSYHQTLNKELAQLAAARQVVLPQAPGADVQAYSRELAELPPSEFEKRYLQVLGEIQTKLIARYKEATNLPLDEQLLAWSTQTLPNLRAHAQTVADLRNQLAD